MRSPRKATRLEHARRPNSPKARPQALTMPSSGRSLRPARRFVVSRRLTLSRLGFAATTWRSGGHTSASPSSLRASATDPIRPQSGLGRQQRRADQPPAREAADRSRDRLLGVAGPSRPVGLRADHRLASQVLRSPARRLPLPRPRSRKRAARPPPLPAPLLLPPRPPLPGPENKVVRLFRRPARAAARSAPAG